MTVAVLFADPKGCYSGVADVDLWDEARDARLYAGPWPVVAHPPCSRWCQLAGLVEARWGHKRGDDGGCFESALVSVRRWGGVLEHPAYTKAWASYGLPDPRPTGGWSRCFCGGWVCHVEQLRYGTPVRKATWLYSFGCELPSLRWGVSDYDPARPLVSNCGNSIDPKRERKRFAGGTSSATPPAFRDVLLAMARSVARAPSR
jgi:hypothetical protein